MLLKIYSSKSEYMRTLWGLGILLLPLILVRLMLVVNYVAAY